MTIKVDKIPSVTLKQLTANGMQDLSTDNVFGGKKVMKCFRCGRVYAHLLHSSIYRVSLPALPSSRPRASTSPAWRSTMRS